MDTINAIQIHKQGGPEELKWERVQIGEPTDNQLRIKHTFIGLNYIDTYHRSGLYPMPNMPGIVGMEASGTVESVGNKVSEFTIGDRVAYAAAPPGAYAESRIIDADKVVKIPDSVSDDIAAAMMLKGMTVEYLIYRTYDVKPGTTVLFHAAAGGVGLIACQWLKMKGATIIGTVGNEEKAVLAKKHGCDHTILYEKENIQERVREITEGKGVPVVFDSVGKSTWNASIECLAPLGMLVVFGNASGPTPPIDPTILASKGSLFFTRPTLMTYTAKREDLLLSANRVIKAVENGLEIKINNRYHISQAEEAHRDLESRKTTGSSIFEV